MNYLLGKLANMLFLEYKNWCHSPVYVRFCIKPVLTWG